MKQKEKIEFYDNLTELLNMGFDLDKNTARDLLACVNYLRGIKEYEKKMKEQEVIS